MSIFLGLNNVPPQSSSKLLEKIFLFLQEKTTFMCKNAEKFESIIQSNHFKGMLSEWLHWDYSGKQEKMQCWFVSAILISVLQEEFIVFVNSLFLLQNQI